jgi:hypothetical protein
MLLMFATLVFAKPAAGVTGITRFELVSTESSTSRSVPGWPGQSLPINEARASLAHIYSSETLLLESATARFDRSMGDRLLKSLGLSDLLSSYPAIGTAFAAAYSDQMHQQLAEAASNVEGAGQRSLSKLSDDQVIGLAIAFKPVASLLINAESAKNGTYRNSSDLLKSAAGKSAVDQTNELRAVLARRPGGSEALAAFQAGIADVAKMQSPLIKGAFCSAQQAGANAVVATLKAKNAAAATISTVESAFACNAG